MQRLPPLSCAHPMQNRIDSDINACHEYATGAPHDSLESNPRRYLLVCMSPLPYVRCAMPRSDRCLGNPRKKSDARRVRRCYFPRAQKSSSSAAERGPWHSSMSERAFWKSGCDCPNRGGVMRPTSWLLRIVCCRSGPSFPGTRSARPGHRGELVAAASEQRQPRLNCNSRPNVRRPAAPG